VRDLVTVGFLLFNARHAAASASTEWPPDRDTALKVLGHQKISGQAR